MDVCGISACGVGFRQAYSAPDSPDGIRIASRNSYTLGTTEYPKLASRKIDWNPHMSQNITVATWDYVACVTDRRLTQLRADGSKVVVTERSNKLSVFECRTGRGFITYSGIGLDGEGQTPSDWLLDLNFSALDFHGVCDLIKATAEPKILAAAKHFGGNPRHTFIMSGHEQGRPVIGKISNYQSMRGEDVAQARPELAIELMAPTSIEAKGAAIISGARHTKAKTRHLAKLKDMINGGTPPEDVRKYMVKIVRDTSYGSGRVGTVGTSVMTGLFRQFGAVDVGGDPVGGATLLEMPNLIGGNARFSEGYILLPKAGEPFASRYDPKTKRFRIAEPACPKCNNPVPEGYRECGRCSARL